MTGDNNVLFRLRSISVRRVFHKTNEFFYFSSVTRQSEFGRFNEAILRAIGLIVRPIVTPTGPFRRRTELWA